MGERTMAVDFGASMAADLYSAILGQTRGGIPPSQIMKAVADACGMTLEQVIDVLAASGTVLAHGGQTGLPEMAVALAGLGSDSGPMAVLADMERRRHRSPVIVVIDDGRVDEGPEQRLLSMLGELKLDRTHLEAPQEPILADHPDRPGWHSPYGPPSRRGR